MMTLTEAAANLWRARQRSLLALLGLMIGSGAVIALVTLGKLAATESDRQFRALGVDLLVIRPGPPVGAEPPAPLQSADLKALNDAGLGVQAVAPLLYAGLQITWHGRQSPANLVGATPVLREIPGFPPVSAGRDLSRFDRPGNYVVIGHDLADALAGGGPAIQPGDRMGIGDESFTVFGILGDQAPNNLLPITLNTSLIGDFASVARVIGQTDSAAAIIKVAPGYRPEPVGMAVNRWFGALHPGKTLAFQTARQMLQTRDDQARLYTVLLGMIACIALVIGGGAVMTVMIMAVNERRAEIGLRLALGARRRDIQALFLAEAGLIALIGAGMGAIIGEATAWGLAGIESWPFRIDWVALVQGIALAILVGIASGFIPAFRASRLDPIAALRAG